MQWNFEAQFSHWGINRVRRRNRRYLVPQAIWCSKQSKSLCSSFSIEAFLVSPLKFWIFCPWQIQIQNQVQFFWNDRSNHPTYLHSFKSRRGIGLKDLFKNVIAWHVWSRDLESVISLNCNRLDICTLSYGGGTDADLLLIEREPSDPDLFEVRPYLKAFIFKVWIIYYR